MARIVMHGLLGIAAFLAGCGNGPIVLFERPGGGSGGESGGGSSGGSGGESGGGADLRMPNPASAGLPNPASYTVDETNDTVTDDVSGLMWQRLVIDEKLIRSEAIDYCNNITVGGYDDWRLPSRIELVSLLDFTRTSPTIDPVAFPNTPGGIYWTSSTWASNPNTAWTVYFSVGYTSGADYAGMVFPNKMYVRCVRLKSFDDYQGDYEINTGTVYDPKTKLTWQQPIAPTKFNWSEAQDYCSGLELEGGGWRVPSMKELQTIVDETKTHPPIDLNVFPDTPDSIFWTSSPRAGKPEYAWEVEFGSFYDGGTSEQHVMNTHAVRCVR